MLTVCLSHPCAFDSAPLSPPLRSVWDVKDPDDVCGICQNNFDGVCGSCKTPRGGDECPLRTCHDSSRLRLGLSGSCHPIVSDQAFAHLSPNLTTSFPTATHPHPTPTQSSESAPTSSTCTASSSGYQETPKISVPCANGSGVSPSFSFSQLSSHRLTNPTHNAPPLSALRPHSRSDGHGLPSRDGSTARGRGAARRGGAASWGVMIGFAETRARSAWTCI